MLDVFYLFEVIGVLMELKLPAEGYLYACLVPLWRGSYLHKGIFPLDWCPYGVEVAYIRVSLRLFDTLMELKLIA